MIKKLPHSARMTILIVICLGIVFAAILSTGKSPAEVISKLFTTSFSSPVGMTDTLKRLTPLLIAGSAVFVALRCGLFNIGVEGQITMGGITAIAIALKVPGIGGSILGVLGGMIAGALWAFPAGWIKAYKSGHEVISTIMLNQIAIQLTAWLVAGPLMDKSAGFPTTASMTNESLLPTFGNGPLVFSISTLIAGGIVGLVAYWSKRTVSGYEFSAVGANPTAAAFSGVNAKRTTLTAMTMSGALGGIAGALQAVAFEGRFFEGFSAGYGYDSLGVALLAGANPVGIFFSGALFAVLGQGAASAQIDGIPKGLSIVILALIVAVVAAVRYSKKVAENA